MELQTFLKQQLKFLFGIGSYLEMSSQAHRDITFDGECHNNIQERFNGEFRTERKRSEM